MSPDMHLQWLPMCATGNPPLYIHTCVHVHGSVSLGTQAHDVPKVACFTVNVYGVYINKAPKDYIMLILYSTVGRSIANILPPCNG